MSNVSRNTYGIFIVTAMLFFIWGIPPVCADEDKSIAPEITNVTPLNGTLTESPTEEEFVITPIKPIEEVTSEQIFQTPNMKDTEGIPVQETETKPTVSIENDSNSISTNLSTLSNDNSEKNNLESFQMQKKIQEKLQKNGFNFLTFDKTPKKVPFKGEFSVLDNPEKTTIPPGSIIFQSEENVTIVFDKNGKQILISDDADSNLIDTPQGKKPATHVFSVPSGSLIKINGSKSQIILDNTTLFTVISETQLNDNNIPDAEIRGWIEAANDYSVDNLSEFDASWEIPKGPNDPNSNSIIYIFNGIMPQADPLLVGTTLIQPVLEWNNGGQSNCSQNWCARPWVIIKPGNNSYHSEAIVLTPEDHSVKGIMTWSEILQAWSVNVQNGAGSRSISIQDYGDSGFGKLGTNNLKVTCALEGYNIYNQSDLPGSITFHDMTFSDTNSNPVVISWEKWYNTTALSSFSGLYVDTPSQSQVTLYTDRLLTDFTAAPRSGPDPLSVQFTDTSTGSPTAWSWNFGDGSKERWSERREHSSVVLPDGGIILTGGLGPRDDSWRSDDNGLTWNQVNAGSTWPPRDGHTTVALPDGSVVLMGGWDLRTGNYLNDVWKSTDRGVTWSPLTMDASWAPRSEHTSVVLPDGSIVLVGGKSGSSLFRDVWISTDGGGSWTIQTSQAPWWPCYGQSAVALSDGSIVVMGGSSGDLDTNDVWRSIDKGKTWSLQTTPGVYYWWKRYEQSSVVLADDTILLMGGRTLGSMIFGDVWKSTDRGATWTQVTGTAWYQRYGHTTNVLSDGSILTMGGWGNEIRRSTDNGLTWSLVPPTWVSQEENPSHTYRFPGLYTVSLTASNPNGSSLATKPDYIAVSEPVQPPVADFSGSPRFGSAPLNVQFTDRSTGSVSSWLWDVDDDGITDCVSQNCSFTYTIPRSYLVKLSVSGTNGSDDEMKMGYITINETTSHLTSSFTASPTYGPVPLTVQFTDASAGGPTGWSWDFGDGDSTNASLQHPVHSYHANRLFTVNLTVSKDGFPSNTTTKVRYIKVNQQDKVGIFRPSSHMYYHDYNGNGVWDGALVDKVTNFGISEDLPASGDWNGDGITEIGVYRNSTSLYYRDYNGSGSWNGAMIDRVSLFGISEDKPISGDWNGDGITEIGVFRPSTKMFYRDYNGDGVWNGSLVDNVTNFGISGDLPASGDWNGDGTTDIGVFRPSTHMYYRDYNGNGVWDGALIDQVSDFGISGDLPASGDWNGDGTTDIGVLRPSTHMYYRDYNGDGVWNGALVDQVSSFGMTGDLPISGKW